LSTQFVKIYTSPTGEEIAYFSYNCRRPLRLTGQCPGCTIPVEIPDEAAWQKAVEIIRDPTEVDEKIKQLTAGDPTTQHRQKTLKDLAEIRKRQTALRKDLSDLSQEGRLDKGTREYLSGQLNILAQQEEDALKQLADEQAFQDKYTKLQERIAQFHQQCRAWREKLDDPQFTPSFDFKREALLFFGISITVRKQGTEPRYMVYADPGQENFS